jgi:adenine-specific DNA-methyltransferase
MIDFAHVAGRAFVDALSRDEQKQMGQFMTPPAIATYMARRLVAGFQATTIRVLEPAAGAGILAAAVIHEILASEIQPDRIELYLFELDGRLIPVLEDLCRNMQIECRNKGVELDWQVSQGDFLLSELALRGQTIDGLFVISNPPYFKINKDDPRSAAHSYAVYGQPNIYGLFMAACARLVGPNGKWCFITPRSWMNGSYFGAMRRVMFRHLHIDALHTFESRTDHFEDDTILQEAVITWATGRIEYDPTLEVLITRSQGVGDLENAQIQAMPLARLIADDEHQMVALPRNGGADPFDTWTATLDSYGFKVSTGPVVPFRSKERICETASENTVPLLWMQHVSPSGISWPIQKKREHICADAGAAWTLVRNMPMVIMRRFSPTESDRRVVAAPYIGDLPAPVLGLENHLNYIAKITGEMTVAEAKGLSAFLNSALVESHFRALAGSTQVNATELRKLPLPPIETIRAIGNAIPDRPTIAQIDTTVNQILGIDQPAQTQAAG